MKTLYHFRTLLVLLLLSGVYACSDNECKSFLFIEDKAWDFNHDEDSSIIGVWKLQYIESSAFKCVEAISCDEENNTYEFTSEGKLIMSYSRTPEYGGEYTYEYGDRKLAYSPDGRLSIYVTLSKDKLILNDAALDGPILYFTRIK